MIFPWYKKWTSDDLSLVQKVNFWWSFPGRLPHSSYSAHHSIAPSVLISTSGRLFGLRRWVHYTKNPCPYNPSRRHAFLWFVPSKMSIHNMVIQLFFFEFILNPAVFIPDENLTLTNIINASRICIWNLSNCNYSWFKIFNIDIICNYWNYIIIWNRAIRSYIEETNIWKYQITIF